MSIQKILVPVDFSVCSANALQVAGQLTQAFKAELTILHAFQIPATHGEPGSASMVNGLSEEVENEAKQNLKEMLAEFHSFGHIHYKSLIIHVYPTEAIESALEKELFDLIVMGTRGSTGIEEKLIGSNTYSVIKNTTIPVLAIPQDQKISDFTDIAFAGDYMKIEERGIFVVLLEICKFFNSTIHILHVDENEENITTDEAFEARKFKQYFKNVNHNYFFINNSDIEAGIYEYLESHKINLLVMIPRKHKVFERIFKESLTKKVACHAKIPLLSLT